MRIQTQFLWINLIGGIAVLGGYIIALINHPETEIKKRPVHVPEENVYMTTHWSVYLGYICALGALYLLINGAFFGG